MYDARLESLALVGGQVLEDLLDRTSRRLRGGERLDALDRLVAEQQRLDAEAPARATFDPATAGRRDSQSMPASL